MFTVRYYFPKCPFGTSQTHKSLGDIQGGKKLINEVFILESLREDDVTNDRLEGELISKILKMGGRKPIYHFVKTKEQFISKINEFESSQYRYLHLSCHGSSNSFEFYFGAMYFNNFINIVHNKLENKRIFISACKAVNEKLANLLIPNSKCYSLIGPYKSIDFDDAAVIWVSYYYLAFKEDIVRMDRKLILQTLKNLTKLYKIDLNYYSISKSRGVKLTKFLGGEIVNKK